MDYLQYFSKSNLVYVNNNKSFKPYYKWITFNTEWFVWTVELYGFVLNLIINGLPSILILDYGNGRKLCIYDVLNLIINGLPSILCICPRTT